MRRLLVATAALALLSSAARAAPQTDDISRHAHFVAHEMLASIDVTDVMMRAADKSPGAFADIAKYRAQWPDLLKAALREEVAADGVVFDDVFAAGFAKSFTLNELKAGEVIIADPAVKAVFVAAVSNRPAPTPKNPPCAPACMRALSSAAGRSFLQKMADFRTILGPEGINEAVARILPGALIRFGQKAQAAEQARQQN